MLVGLAEVSDLGPKVGSGCLKPELAKVQGIRDWPVPQTRKRAQASKGTGGSCPTLAPMAGEPDKGVWTEPCQGDAGGGSNLGAGPGKPRLGHTLYGLQRTPQTQGRALLDERGQCRARGGRLIPQDEVVGVSM